MKVFLSSTGRDLKAHRQAAFDAIQRLEEMKCVRMEDFRGPAVPIEDFDTQKVAGRDLFVIILGHLHGACPNGSEKSYTELEYEAAVDLKKPIFLFLAPEDFPLPAALIEDDAKRARQRKLRDRAAGLIPNSFTSPDDHAHNLLARRALDTGNRAEARRHAEIARERAWCDGPPHCYKPALDEAEALLAKTAP